MSLRQKRGSALGPTVLRSTPYRAAVLADSPLAFWLLNEASGSTFGDSSGNGRSLTITGTPTFGATALGTGLAIEGTAVTLASGQKATGASPTWLNGLSGLTVELWLKTTSSTDMMALSRDDGASNRQFQVRKTASTNHLEMNFWNSSGSLTTLDTPGTYTDGNPHHVVMAADATARNIYVDGLSVISGAGITVAPLTSSTQALLLGDYSGSGFQWVGGLQAVAIYGSALSAARVFAHYQAGV